jgi:hypothetical protein
MPRNLPGWKNFAHLQRCIIDFEQPANKLSLAQLHPPQRRQANEREQNLEARRYLLDRIIALPITSI